MRKILILTVLLLTAILYSATDDIVAVQSPDYNWMITIHVYLPEEVTAICPTGADNLYSHGSSSRDEGAICEYTQSGLFFISWVSDVNPTPLTFTDIYLPGDSDYNHAYYPSVGIHGEGYYMFTADAFFDETRAALKEYSDGDTLHIRLMHHDALGEWFVWGLDTVFEPSSVSPSGIEIDAHMESAGHDGDVGELPMGHETWNADYYYCFPLYLGIEERPTTTPTEYEIAQNSPNPFNSTTSIDYTIPEHANVSLDVFDISGRHIKGLVNENLNSGRYSVKWDGTDESGNTVPSGTYFYKIKAGDYEAERKMLFVK